MMQVYLHQLHWWTQPCLLEYLCVSTKLCKPCPRSICCTSQNWVVCLACVRAICCFLYQILGWCHLATSPSHSAAQIPYEWIVQLQNTQKIKLKQPKRSVFKLLKITWQSVTILFVNEWNITKSTLNSPFSVIYVATKTDRRPLKATESDFWLMD